MSSSPGRWPHVSHSSLTMLTACERKWAFKYRDDFPDSPTTAMSKGLLFHRLWGAWWETGDWVAEAKVAGEEWIAENPDAEQMPAWYDDASWLFERYTTNYGPTRDTVEVVANEMPFRVRLPHKLGWLTGRFDALWRIDGRLYLVELKTMSDWDRLDAFEWDPQLSLYMWVAQQTLKEQPWAILLDAARTYRWKSPRPPEESFRRLWLDRNDTHLEMAVEEAVAGLDRAKAILKGAHPLRHVSRDCSWCPYQSPCQNEMAFGDLATPDQYIMEG